MQKNQSSVFENMREVSLIDPCKASPESFRKPSISLCLFLGSTISCVSLAKFIQEGVLGFLEFRVWYWGVDQYSSFGLGSSICRFAIFLLQRITGHVLAPATATEKL
jgi:hypothetical protein